MTLYERIRKLRIEQKITQDGLARMMGYKDRSMITKIESGKVDISQTKVVEFAKVLNTTPGYLMGWEDEKNHVVIQNMSQFAHLLQYMPEEDYNYVIAAFDRANMRMKEKGIEP